MTPHTALLHCSLESPFRSVAPILCVCVCVWVGVCVCACVCVCLHVCCVLIARWAKFIAIAGSRARLRL
jgi:hypothetical protein